MNELMWDNYRTGDPYLYTIWEHERKFAIYPVPTAAAGTTTLTGAHTAAVTTITVASTTNFPTEGRIKIDDEVIYYTNTTSTTCTGASRGQERTTAATHSDAATVTIRNIELYGYKRPISLLTNYTTGTAVATNGSKTVTGTSTAWSDNKIVKAGHFFGFGSAGSIGSASTSFPTEWYEISTVDSNTQLTLVNNYDEKTESSAIAYIITDRSDIPEEFMESVIMYAMYLAELKDDSKEEAALNLARYSEMVKEIISKQAMPDYLPISKSTPYVRNYGFPKLPSAFPPYPNW